MNETNSFPVASTEVPVPPKAVAELPIFAGGQWHEPDPASLRQQLRHTFQDSGRRQAAGQAARRTVEEGHGLRHGRERIEGAIAEIERRFCPEPVAPVRPTDLPVVLEGEFFAGHSFANVNEQLALGLSAQPGLALRLKSPRRQPGSEQISLVADRLRPLFQDFADGPQVTIRHAFPPDWSKPERGKWIHVQPWEFGALPADWVGPLRDQVDEIWAPSRLVADVYLRSGIPADKIQVIPWGVAADVFHPEVPARILPTAKSFRFLFVGGTIHRKGFDLLLDAYLAEFSAQDDVCLVVKDLGSKTYYRGQNDRERILATQRNPEAPEIVYFDEDDWTAGQLASLYAACHCLVAPYRGEGFGLPILEAMACGLPPIVPRGGPSDDFVTESTGYFLPSETVETHHSWKLCGPATELQIDPVQLRQALRMAFRESDRTRRMGREAASAVRDHSWERTVALMAERMRGLARAAPQPSNLPPARHVNGHARAQGIASACVLAPSHPRGLGALLARLVPFFDELLVLGPEPQPLLERVCNEYRARWLGLGAATAGDVDGVACKHVRTPWYCWIDAAAPPKDLSPEILRASLAECDPGEGSAVVEVGRGARLEFRSVRRPPEALWTGGGLAAFARKHQPHLRDRAFTFEAALRHLSGNRSNGLLIVEAGCVRAWDDWGAGQSTLIFDDFAQAEGGRLISVDVDPQNCRHARERCSTGVEIVNEDSVTFFHRYSREQPRSIDLLYLDSVDVDWNAPHRAALQQLHEFCAAQPALRPGALVMLDDHRNNEGKAGKSAYLGDYLNRMGATVLAEGYQLVVVVK